jgi:hypothetical protein
MWKPSIDGGSAQIRAPTATCSSETRLGAAKGGGGKIQLFFVASFLRMISGVSRSLW